MLRSWITANLRFWILIPLLSVSGIAFALASELAIDHNTMSEEIVENSITSQTPHDMKVVAMTEHCKSHLQQQCQHHCGGCVGCAILPAELADIVLSHDAPEYSYLTDLIHPYLAPVLKPPRT